MSADANAIFGAVASLSAVVHLDDKIKQKKAQIELCVSKTCGNCWHWMKTTCVLEKEQGLFRSMNDRACKRFSLDPGSQKLAWEFEQELETIEKKRKVYVESFSPTR